MTRGGWFGLLCLGSCALLPALTHASQPDPIHCSWEECPGRRPKNSTADPSAQYSFQGTLRDNQGSPWPNFPWQQAFVNQWPLYIGDLDCDGLIALSDLSLWQKHFIAP